MMVEPNNDDDIKKNEIIKKIIEKKINEPTTNTKKIKNFFNSIFRPRQNLSKQTLFNGLLNNLDEILTKNSSNVSFEQNNFLKLKLIGLVKNTKSLNLFIKIISSTNYDIIAFSFQNTFYLNTKLKNNVSLKYFVPNDVDMLIYVIEIIDFLENIKDLTILFDEKKNKNDLLCFVKTIMENNDNKFNDILQYAENNTMINNKNISKNNEINTYNKIILMTNLILLKNRIETTTTTTPNYIDFIIDENIFNFFAFFTEHVNQLTNINQLNNELNESRKKEIKSIMNDINIPIKDELVTLIHGKYNKFADRTIKIAKEFDISKLKSIEVLLKKNILQIYTDTNPNPNEYYEFYDNIINLFIKYVGLSTTLITFEENNPRPRLNYVGKSIYYYTLGILLLAYGMTPLARGGSTNKNHHKTQRINHHKTQRKKCNIYRHNKNKLRKTNRKKTQLKPSLIARDNVC
jgi:hypothetical protein